MSKSPSSRSKGGQPGNTNALKHGFYSDHFSDLELTDLETSLSSGLGDEIALLRVMIRRFSVACNNEPQIDINLMSSHLHSIGSAMTKLSHLLKVDKYLTGSSDGEVMGAISNAIAEFTERLKS